ncbi:ParM/StbA family protein [Vibrio campbellii]|uniref:ParM/StbA family protein n=1 Tax=Vibrio campbellii TaxID=680 RepID=UPI000CD3618F|nr:ParM/StbA family protein [Vibrio campbellii]AUW07445.1 hypothetical protein C1N51_27710 [Vibrio campbellii]
MNHLNVEVIDKASIDDGSSAIKAAFDKGDGVKTHSFESRVIRNALPDNKTVTGFSASSYEINGEKYAVVEDSDGIVPTTTVTYQTSEVNRVLVHHMLKQIGMTGKVSVLVTLPVDQFLNSDGSRNQQLIEAKIANIKGEITYLDGTKPAEIVSVIVVPEGVPAYQYACSELSLGGESNIGRYFVIDIGGTTTDILDIKNGQIVSSGSLPIGALEMIESFKGVIKNRLGFRSVPDSDALEGILTGRTLHNDFSSEAKIEIEKFNKRLSDHVLTDGQYVKYTNVIYSGGGANLVEPEMHNAVKTSNPRFDNALGGLQILQSIGD